MKMETERRAAACFVLLAALVGCQRKPSASADSAQAENSDDPDRAELVLQPLGQWTPADASRKLDIQLIGEKSSFLAGGTFRYRLEIRNVGRDPVVFKESAPSFIKDGSLCGGSDFRFSATPAGGAEQDLPCEPAPSAAAGSGLDLTLKPGEYLLTRPARQVRDLRTAYRFDKPGTYRIKAYYDAGGLRAESNAVVLDVVKLVKPSKGPQKPFSGHPQTAAPTEKKHE